MLLHYEELAADLDGSMRSLARRLGIAVDERGWPQLTQAATFSSMRAEADRLVPDTFGVLKDRSAFFREGISGKGRALLTPEQYAEYLGRTTELARPGLQHWLHRHD